MKNFLLIIFLFLSAGHITAQVSPLAFKMKFNQGGFIKNEGQFLDEQGNANNQVEYLFGRKDFHLLLKKGGFSYELIQESINNSNFPESGFSDPEDLKDWQDDQPLKETIYRFDIALVGANENAEIVAEEKKVTTYNYYLGENKILNVPSFDQITYKNIYEGIDLVFEIKSVESEMMPEYSFVIHPGADASQIKIKYGGTGNLFLEDAHTLSILTPGGFIKETGLHGYFPENNVHADVAYNLNNNLLSFRVTTDKSKTLIIDPFIVWGSYFGGTASENFDTELEIALDNTNHIFLTGSTTSTSYIATSGAVMETYGGSRDMFVAKFSLDGSEVEWATYFGGNGQDVSYGVGCDHQNNVIITGFTESSNVITTAGVFQTERMGKSDVIIVKFTNSGSLIWSTLMGGASDSVEHENGRSLIFDDNDNIFLTGYCVSSTNISTIPSYQKKYKGGGDCFLVKFNSSGQKIWGTYFGGKNKDRAHDLCADRFGNLYFVGTLQSSGIMSGGFQTTFGGNTDGFIAKFDTAGNFGWSSYYGGSNGDHGRSVECDYNGNSYFDGWTSSTGSGVISTSNSFQPTIGGTQDGFIAKFTPAGVRVWGTYYGSSGTETLYALGIDTLANVYVAGSTTSSSGIATSGTLQETLGSAPDALIAKFDSSGQRIWATYLGSIKIENAYSMEVMSPDLFFVALDGHGNLPVSDDAYQTVNRGQDDLAVFKIDFNPPHCEDVYEGNDSMQQAYLITDTLTHGGITIEAGISSASDHDWFAIPLYPRDRNCLNIIVSFSANYDLNVFDSDSNLITSSANPDSTEEEVSLYHVTGTIYVEVAHDSLNFDFVNCYELGFVLEDSSGCNDAQEPNDSIQSPFMITDTLTHGGITLTGAIDSSDDQDWFEIPLYPRDRIVSITLSGLTQNYDLFVYDTAGALVTSSANADTAVEYVSLYHLTGLFNIQIAHDSLNFDFYNCYTLKFVLEDSSGCPDLNEPNDSIESAYFISDSLAHAGTTLTGSISSSEDQDWFAVDAQQLGGTLNSYQVSTSIILSGLTTNYDLNVYSSDTTIISSSSNADTASEVIEMNDYTGVLFIQIVHDSAHIDPYNCYSISVKLKDSLICTDNFEPNNSSGVATVIPISDSTAYIHSEIATAGDIDFYLFTNTVARPNIKLLLTSLPKNFNLFLFNYKPKQIGASKNKKQKDEIITFNNSSVGNYYAKIVGSTATIYSDHCYDLYITLSSAPYRLDNPEVSNQPDLSETPLLLYPNPTNGLINFDFASDKDDASIVTVYDLVGRVVYLESFSQLEGTMTYSLDLSFLHQGLYVVEVKTSKETVTSKFSIEK